MDERLSASYALWVTLTFGLQHTLNSYSLLKLLLKLDENGIVPEQVVGLEFTGLYAQLLLSFLHSTLGESNLLLAALHQNYLLVQVVSNPFFVAN